MSEPIAPGGLYSYRNQPQSHEVAWARLHELEIAVQSIETQLKYGNPKEFPTDDDFLAWKGRATGAMAHYKAEIAYLERWVGARGSQFSQDGRTAIEEIAASVSRMVAQVRQQYKRVYVEGHVPPNLVAARKRKQELLSATELCLDFFKELKAKAEVAGIGEDRMIELRRPLSTIYAEIMSERGLTGKFFRENNPEGVDWVLFPLSLLERAVSSGFVLTDKERETIEKIRDERLSRMQKS